MRERSVSEPLNLELDAGNSRVKWRLVGRKHAVDPSSGVIGWEELTQNSLDFLSGVRLDKVLLSSVAEPELTQRLQVAIQENAPAVPCFRAVSCPELAGITFGYKQIRKLGVDRCLAMLAAWHRVQDAVLVVDAGSAITADIVDCHGVHQGGYIFPGVSLLKQSLLHGTAAVPVADGLKTDTGLGRDTEDCVDHALNLMLQGVLRSLSVRAGEYSVAHTFFTGGSAQWLMSLLAEPFGDYVPDLVLDGLSLAEQACEEIDLRQECSDP